MWTQGYISMVQLAPVRRPASSSMAPSLTSLIMLQVAVVDAPDRAALSEAWKMWMEEHIQSGGAVPPGNESGNKAWTTRTVRRVRPDIKLMPGPNTKLTLPLSELLAKVVNDFEIIAFIKGTRTAPQCGFSHRMLTILNEQGANYETLNVLDEEHNAGVREALKDFSSWPTIPQLYIRGEFVGGADILEEMLYSGQLQALLKKQ
eukprot:SM000019S05073  [mRNA]  locus=s19:785219:786275:- [translate_table: standard]